MLATEALPTSLAEESWYLPSGQLVIRGGGSTVPGPDTTPRGSTTAHQVMKAYIGEQTPVVVIPSALANPNHSTAVRERYSAMGSHNVTCLHTQDRPEGGKDVCGEALPSAGVHPACVRHYGVG